jgi:hypothetical protein
MLKQIMKFPSGDFAMLDKRLQSKSAKCNPIASFRRIDRAVLHLFPMVINSPPKGRNNRDNDCKAISPGIIVTS